MTIPTDPTGRQPAGKADPVVGGPARPAPEGARVTGGPAGPSPALAIGMAERLAPGVRASRRRRAALSLLVLAVCLAVAAGAALLAGRLWGVWRGVMLTEGFVLGFLLALGAVVSARPLELAAGVPSRDARGRILLGASVRGLALLVPISFREAIEGLVYGLGLVPTDPASEVAAWLMLALAPPHGPGPDVWASLEGIDPAVPHRLPEDLRAAVATLRRRGWVEVDSSRYPPRLRLLHAGLEFVGGGRDADRP